MNSVQFGSVRYLRFVDTDGKRLNPQWQQEGSIRIAMQTEGNANGYAVDFAKPMYSESQFSNGEMDDKAPHLMMLKDDEEGNHATEWRAFFDNIRPKMNHPSLKDQLLETVNQILRKAHAKNVIETPQTVYTIKTNKLMAEAEKHPTTLCKISNTQEFAPEYALETEG